jgi:hypothetical protein
MQTEATVSINGAEPVPATFGIEVERIDVSTFTASKPDMRWEFRDAAGHFHAYDHQGELPTIVRREEVIRVDRDESSDGSAEAEHMDDEEWMEDAYTVTHIECALCGEEVDPKRLAVDPHKVIPGRTSYTLTLHGPIPAGRFSVVVTAGDRVFFGFAEGRLIGSGHDGTRYFEAYEAWCGPMSWRKRAA